MTAADTRISFLSLGQPTIDLDGVRAEWAETLGLFRVNLTDNDRLYLTEAGIRVLHRRLGMCLETFGHQRPTPGDARSRLAELAAALRFDGSIDYAAELDAVLRTADTHPGELDTQPLPITRTTATDITDAAQAQPC
ncbi:hypothetical protein AB0L97_32755 [Nocardia sp. NPDC051911]|uniref:hypothetical protein n=1 Tax=Nocardia sp. NPDC051911 TaxID=3154648 RepID=UPI003444EFD6